MRRALSDIWNDLTETWANCQATYDAVHGEGTWLTTLLCVVAGVLGIAAFVFGMGE